MTKIDVENLAVLVYHDIVRVAVTNTKNKSGHTIASTRMSESFDGLSVSIETKRSNREWKRNFSFYQETLILGPFIFFFNPFVKLS